MEREKKVDRPGQGLFLAGAILLLGATLLGFDQIRRGQEPETGWQAPLLSFPVGGIVRPEFHAIPPGIPVPLVVGFLGITFGLGAFLMLLGLRLMTGVVHRSGSRS